MPKRLQGDCAGWSASAGSLCNLVRNTFPRPIWYWHTEPVYKYSRPSLSRIPRDSLKHFEISVPRNIRVAEVKKTINRTITFNKWVCKLTPELQTYWKYCGKEEQFLLFSTILCYIFLDFYVKTGTRISLRDKRVVRDNRGRDNERWLYNKNLISPHKTKQNKSRSIIKRVTFYNGTEIWMHWFVIMKNKIIIKSVWNKMKTSSTVFTKFVSRWENVPCGLVSPAKIQISLCICIVWSESHWVRFR